MNLQFSLAFLLVLYARRVVLARMRAVALAPLERALRRAQGEREHARQAVGGDQLRVGVEMAAGDADPLRARMQVGQRRDRRAQPGLVAEQAVISKDAQKKWTLKNRGRKIEEILP